jgi:vitamin B12 transporter
MSFSKIAFVLSLIFILSPFSTPAFAMSEEEKSFLLMYFKEEEIQVISATRSLKSISRVAENVEVVTKEDIELMNAHTLADVLNNVNGVQVSFTGTSPGSSAILQVQGSSFEHVLVLVDGVRINDVSGGIADVSLIPVQMIDKVEVIKGPTSSVWGSSLGGIVNVITKAPAGDGTHGMVSGAYGERNTGDFRAEVNGKKNGIGYYLYAGRLQTDGFRPREADSRNSLYAKLSYDFSKDTIAIFNILYNKAQNESGDFEDFGLRVDTKDELMLSSLSLKSRLSDAVSLDVSARASQKLSGATTTDIIAGTITPSDSHDNKYGASAKLEYRQGIHSVVFGADYDLYQTKASFLGEDRFDEHISAVYLNDTFALGKLSIIPGIRLDSIDIGNTSLKETALSPSLGATYEFARKTIIRGVVASGFNTPAVADLFADSIFFVKNPDLKLEKVWSYQIGVETGAMKYVWVKASGFRHDVRDAITREDISVADGTWTFVNKAKVRRQGIEVEMKTMPIYNFTLSAATSYIHTEDRETGEEIRGNPTYTYDIGLQYDDKRSFRALLKGHYIWWNSTEDMNAKYSSFIFDVNAIKTLCKSSQYTAEAFLTVHNLFDGAQYWLTNYKNAGRWIEVGVRVKL